MNTDEITEIPVESLTSDLNDGEKPEINLDLSEEVPVESASNKGVVNGLIDFFSLVKIILLKVLSIINSHFFTFMGEMKDLYNESKEKMN